MRPDMSEVLIERPRYGHALRYPRAWTRNRWTTTDDDHGPRVEAMGGFYREKNFDDHLGPLRRYLQSNVGRPWSKVRSEMAEHLRPASTVQRHVMEHVWGFVIERTWHDEAGVLWGSDPYGRPTIVGGAWSRRSQFYVHPKTGLLLRAPMTPRKRKKDRRQAEVDPNVRWVSPRLQHRKIDGIWFEVELAPLPESTRSPWSLGPPVWDVAARRLVRRRGLVWNDPHSMADEWRQGRYASAMRQLSRKEIRAALRVA